MLSNPLEFLRSMFDGAVAAAAPEASLAEHLPPPPRGRTVVVGAGKAAAAMASVVEQAWFNQKYQGAISGLVITRYGHSVRTKQIEVVEAAHPVPDQVGLEAARRTLDLVRMLGPDDLVLCLVSGGGSALLTLPVEGITLEEKQSVTQQMLRCGATISEINCVRKHLSAIKGGQLAQSAVPAKVVTLMISDVPGNDPSVIASGPTVADPTTFADARAVLAKYNIKAPPAVTAHLMAAVGETPKPKDPMFERTSVRTIVTPQDALEAAATVAEKAGFRSLILSDSVEGESRAVALTHAAIIRQILECGKPVEPPCVLLSGGETTVTIRGDGRGGPNAEFLLALGIALDGEPSVHAIACDTDGIDGSEDNAGAFLSPNTLERALLQGSNAQDYLSNNDAYAFFREIGDLVVTGPTRTNVNDFRAILVEM